MNLGVRVSGFRVVMRLPSPSKISEETHMHRRMTLERMMLDSFVLTGGFELPCFRLWAERTRTSIQLFVCVCVGSRMSKHESPAQMCRTLGICLTFTQLKLNTDALWGCLMRRWEKKQGMKWTTEGLSINLPSERCSSTGPGLSFLAQTAMPDDP